MKIEMDRNDLLKAVQSVLGAVSKKSTLPVLSFIYMASDGQETLLIATDLETTLRYRMRCESNPFTVLIPAYRFYDILRNLSDGSRIVLDIKEGKTSIQCGRSRFSLSTLNQDDFPLLRDSDPLHSMKIKSSVFKYLLETAGYCSAKQDVRYYLNGVLIEVEHDLNVVATDGHRLAKVSYESETALSKEKIQSIISTDAVNEIKKILNKDEEECTISISTNQLMIESGSSTLITKLIDGSFPDYERIIPKERKHRIEVSRSLLFDAIKRVSLIVSDQKSLNGVECIFKDHLLTLTAKSSDDLAEESIEIEYDDNEAHVGFNYRYLLDALGAMQSDRVSLDFTEIGTSSVVITGMDQEDGLHILMPMRL